MMVRSRTRLQSLCPASRVMARVRVAHRSPNFRSNVSCNFVKNDPRMEFSGNGFDKSFSCSKEKTGCGGVGDNSRIMVVIDASPEAKGALQWALSHSVVQSQDTITLLYVSKQSKMRPDLGAYQLLNSMKNMCHMRRPEVHVEVALLEGKEKGPIIVEEAKKQRVSLLVLGQRKRPMLWRLLRRTCVGNKKRREPTEYCIQNANCMTIAVRRNNKKLGGYLITTKQHRNFWLLA